jgi:hypothetical protein
LGYTYKQELEIKKQEVFKKVAPLFPELRSIVETEVDVPNPVPSEASIKVGSIKPSFQPKGMGAPAQKKTNDSNTQKIPIKLSKNTMVGKKEEKPNKRSITPKDS